MDSELRFDKQVSFHLNGVVRTLRERSFSGGRPRFEVYREFCTSGICTLYSRKIFAPDGSISSEIEQRFSYGTCLSKLEKEFNHRGELVKDLTTSYASSAP